MTNAPETSIADLFANVSTQWERLAQIIYLPDEERMALSKHLDSMLNVLCDAEFGTVRSHDDQMLQFMDACDLMSAATKFSTRLQQVRTDTTETHDDPTIAEDMNVLITDLNRFRYELARKYVLPQPRIPEHRKYMKVSDIHPDYPTYPEGVLLGDDLQNLRTMRETFEAIHVADRLLATLPPDDSTAGKTLVSQHPSITRLIGSDPPASPHGISHLLQSVYANAYNNGVAIFSRSFGADLAENFMVREADAIEAFHAQPRSTTTRPTGP